jgi:hypothetical protein
MLWPCDASRFREALKAAEKERDLAVQWRDVARDAAKRAEAQVAVLVAFFPATLAANLKDALLADLSAAAAEHDARIRREAVEAERTQLMAIVNAQAEDEGLWFVAQTMPEGYLQEALRKIHAAIEDAPSEETT